MDLIGIGPRFKQAREAAGLSVKDCARLSGQTVAEVERNERGWGYDAYKHVYAKAFDVDVHWLMIGVGRGTARAPKGTEKAMRTLKACLDQA